MRRICVLPLALAASLAGCPCPAFDGLDEQISYRSCGATPASPVQRSSEWAINIDTADPLVVQWGSDDPATVSVTGDTEDAVLRAWEVGAAEVTSTLDDGTSDRTQWEVVQATSGSLTDMITEFVTEQSVDNPEFVGEFPVEPVGDLLRLTAGTTLALDLTLADAQGRAVQWTPTALTGDGSLRVDDDRAFVRIATSAVGHVLDDAGSQLLEIAVIAVDSIGSGAIALGVYAPEREEPSADAEASTLAYLRAIVTDGGDRIWQPPVAWSVVSGPGAVASFVDGEWDETLARTDVAELRLEGDLAQWETAQSCVAASIETLGGTVVRSAWISPDEVTVYDNGVCGNRGCACAAQGPSRGPAAVGAMAVFGALLRRRRQGLQSSCSSKAPASPS